MWSGPPLPVATHAHGRSMYLEQHAREPAALPVADRPSAAVRMHQQEGPHQVRIDGGYITLCQGGAQAITNVQVAM